MSEQDQKQTPRKTKLKRITLQVAGFCARLLMYWSVIVIFLGVIYWVAPPVSTLMIGDWFRGQNVSRTYVSLDEISPYLPRAVIASEDASYCRHSGIDWEALNDVIKAAIKRGPSRGASTIAMQTAKNLFMVSSRSYIRKGLEIPVAMYLDLIWSKRKMIEIYLNIAEWGNGIYGAEAAAQHYFRKSAKNLTRQEAALLAVALPNPIQRNAGRPNNFHRVLAGQLLQRMNLEGDVDFCFR
ncbi:monofunctional biosynthetic peptidoglycan transglycosylase [Microvirga sp. W0021]|uniref:Biosynthetic peptidoglycan transglycosylase n=1 Tax=Hohaiivirga grylli TaxID=3133970 RepID=A0ABV0BM73_9HYPH